MKKKYAYWGLSAIIVALGVWGLSQNYRVKNMQIKIENNYNRAFHELVDYVDDIDTLLQKSMLVSTPSQMASISGELFRETSAAKTCLGQLPVSEVQLENTEKFLSQVGDYTYVLSQNVINNGAISEEDYNNLNSLGKYASTLNDALLSMQTDIYDGKISFGTVKSEMNAHLSTVASAAGDVLSDFAGVEKEFQEYPSLIYDGPFSEHIEKIQPVMFENKKDISKETALAVAKKFLGDKGRNLVYETESANNILPSYSFVGQNDNGNVINIAITKKGGFPVYFTENRETGEEKLELSEAVQKAREFLYSRGYVSLKESYYEKGNGVATVNFAYEQGGVICYSDWIKVKVALDNGEILGTEMHGYIMNHKYRDFPTAALSENDARGKINSHLNVEKSNMALIPKDGETEKLCYEFTGTHNGRHFIIYINAENGCEEEILMLIESENGVLTM